MRYQMTYEEFMEHVEATDSTVTRTGDVSEAHGDYLGRECHIGTYHHDTQEAELHCI